MKRSRMKGWLVSGLALTLAMGIITCAGAPPKPVLTQATLIESLGPEGTRVKATGQGKDSPQALVDARRSAIGLGHRFAA